jgi:transcription elongation GreA/GreB family factor
LKKEDVHNACLNHLKARIQEISSEIKALTEDSKDSAKSTAGDKHETAGAMVHLEQEKLNKRLSILSEQLNQIEKIKIQNISNSVTVGSLVLTDKGYFFIASALGKISVEGENVFVVSASSPLALKLLGLSTKDTVEVNGTVYEVKEIL